MGAVARVQNAVEAQRHQAMLWAPVALAIGIGGYFALPVEPSFAARAALLIVSLLAMALAARARAILCLLLLLVPLGIGVTADRAARLAAPVIDGRYYGPILGQVVHVDRSSSNALRVTLETVYLPSRASLPQRVRVSLHGSDASAHPGDWIATTGHLSAPSGPAEPGGFDFRRYAWFQRLGAVGYTRSPVLHSDPPAGQSVQPVPLARLRMALADWIRAQMPARTGGFAAAILVGDRSSLDPKDVDALRATNLAHLLAISGLHMGLVTGCVFLVVRRGLVLVPGSALPYPA
ncbi:MAG: ComEC/Rec2 family competence protein, partial [Pseudomonadota bacterium]